MTDETTPTPVEDDTTGEQAPPEQAPEETPTPRRRRKAKDAEDEGDPTKRYAAYNKSLGRYVGGVRDTKAEADKIAKQITDAGHQAEVREF